MGMFSEANAADNAQRLEKILLEAIKSGNDGVKEFAKKNLYEWYNWELGETFGYVKPNPEIEEAFKTVKKIVDLDSHAFGGININSHDDYGE